MPDIKEDQEDEDEALVLAEVGPRYMYKYCVCFASKTLVLSHWDVS